MALGRASLVAAALFVAAGCRVFDESLLDAAMDAPEDGGGTCDPATPPAHPPGEDPGGTTKRVLALHSIDLQQTGERWRTVGYDLDERCSEAPEYDVECKPAAAITPEDDGVDGVDNVFGHRMANALVVLDLDLEAIEARLEQGAQALLVQIDDYTGESDDGLVVATVTQSAYGTAGEAGDAMPEPPGTGETLDPPRWDGDDWFFPRIDGFVSGDPTLPRFRDGGAYVADGTLVVQVPDRFPILFSSETASLFFELTGAVLTVDLESGDATLAGRWGRAEILERIEDAGLCGETPNSRVSAFLDQRADVRSIPGSGGDVTCDALSVGLTFHAVDARLADIVPSPALPNPCEL